ncbi:MAG: VanZ family protein [Erysipelotrichaceae bacterium]|nr:VanZ family protein [Erysipelotrichaceae bacterium]
MMKMKHKYVKGLFVVYLFLLVWIIIFKTEFSIEPLKGLQGINLEPFKYVKRVGNTINFADVIENIVVFIPFGLLLKMVNRHISILYATLLFFTTSLFFEVMQYVLCIGISDITDLITNTLGGMIGLALYHVLYLGFKKKTDRVLKVALTVGMLVFMLLYSFLLLVN